MTVTVVATAVGALLLHRAAVLERQALHTQQFQSAVFGLQLRKRSSTAVADANTAFGLVRHADPAEAARLRPSYLAYLRSPAGAAPRRVATLEGKIAAESARQANRAHVENPRARLALIIGLAAVIVLVSVLIWQFAMQRRGWRLEREIAERSAELIRLRDELVAAVSHELRTPLTSIIGYLDLVRDPLSGELSEEQASFLDVIRRNAERLHQNVSDLLLVAETRGQMIVLDLTDVELWSLATDCVEAAQPAADAKRISLSLSGDGDDPIAGDGVRLAQMMDNLVSNAIKFTPAGGRVDVRTATAGKQAVFEVHDSGVGISAADQERLFTHFYRARSAVDDAIPGTGLGLAITKAIVDAHGGTIDLESAEGEGTTFRVRLPKA